LKGCANLIGTIYLWGMLIAFFIKLVTHPWGIGIIISLGSAVFAITFLIKGEAVYWPFIGIINGLVLTFSWLYFKEWVDTIQFLILFLIVYFLGASVVQLFRKKSWRISLGIAFSMVIVLVSYVSIYSIVTEHHHITLQTIRDWIFFILFVGPFILFIFNKIFQKNGVVE
jgi:hypothetical protein